MAFTDLQTRRNLPSRRVSLIWLRVKRNPVRFFILLSGQMSLIWLILNSKAVRFVKVQSGLKLARNSDP